jgi:hypothetical protein
MLPLIAAGVGALRTGLGIAGARHAKKTQMRAIDRAYGVAQTRLLQGQQDARQSLTESEIGRGIVQMGAAQPGGSLAHAANHGTAPHAPWQPANTTDELWHAQSSRGAAGPRNTLAGHEQSQMTDEFWNDRAELAAERKDDRRNVKAQANAGYGSAIANGVNTALSVYSAGKGLESMRGGMGNVAPNVQPVGMAPFQAPPLSPEIVQGAYGINPVDPTLPATAAPALPNWMFNVSKEGNDPFGGGY